MLNIGKIRLNKGFFVDINQKIMKINKKRKFTEFFTKNPEKSRKIDFLVLHHIEADSIDHAIEQFVEHKVSSHFVIDEKGKIFELVDENDVAYHAGHSFWQGVDGLNQSSIGIEFVNKNAFSKKFKKAQMRSGSKLCAYLIAKYKIKPKNIVGHSDIAYFPQQSFEEHGIRLDGFLDRKQDPSQFFDWKFLWQQNIGIYPQIDFKKRDKILFKFANKSDGIAEIKRKLADFGYKVTNFDGEFDLEMKLLVRAFQRRFNQKKFKTNPDIWWQSSQFCLDQIV